MTPTMRRNLMVAPVVVIVRGLILLPLLALLHIGRFAEGAFAAADAVLPGFEREPKPDRRARSAPSSYGEGR